MRDIDKLHFIPGDKYQLSIPIHFFTKTTFSSGWNMQVYVKYFKTQFFCMRHDLAKETTFQHCSYLCM